MFGLTQLGVVHTLLSLIAVIAAVVAFAQNRRIEPASVAGQIYVAATVLSCLTGFGIFQHGGFGKPHVLGILTLLTLGIVWLARKTTLFSTSGRRVETVAMTATFFFHLIPGITETSTRLPLGAPLLPNADAPELKVATGVLLVIFLMTSALQVRGLNSAGGISRGTDYSE